MIPKNKHQLAVMLYNQTVKELQNDPDEWLNFLKFAAKVHKYSFKDQVLLFANNPNAELVADFDQWNSYGRRIKSRQKSITIFDSKSNRIKGVFDISQTWGSDIKVFNWDFSDQDQEMLLNHWQETVGGTPNFNSIVALDFRWDDVLNHILSTKTSDPYLHQCAKFVISERMGLPIPPTAESVARATLAGNSFDEVMASIDQPVKEILLDTERILESKYQKERVSYNERIKRTATEPTLPDKPDWATVSSGRDSLQSPTGRTGGSFEPTRNDRKNVSSETRRGKSSPSTTTKIRGDVLPQRQEERGSRAGENRQSLHEIIGEYTSTRFGDGENSALSDAPPTSQGDNPSGIQVNNDNESVAPKASDFSFAPTSSTRQQLALFGEPKEVEVTNSVLPEEVDSALKYITDLNDRFGTSLARSDYESIEKLKSDLYTDDQLLQSFKVNTEENCRLSFADRFQHFVFEHLQKSEKTVIKILGDKALQEFLTNEIIDEIKSSINAQEAIVEIQPEVDDLSLNVDAIIDKELLKGSGFESGKYRIYHYFQTESHHRKRAEFLKKEYGIGGSTSPGFDSSYDAKGFILRRTDREDHDGRWLAIAKLSWSKVEKRVNQLIDDGRYLNDEEFLKYQELYPNEGIEVEEKAPLSLFDFGEVEDLQDDVLPETDGVSDITMVIHELVETDVMPVLDHEIETVEPEPASNFKFPEGDFYSSTKRGKFSGNVDAILLLKELEETGRTIDENDQYVLAQYVGWGGLSEVFDLHNEDWKEAYVELKEVLSSNEYRAALDSVLTAYYTDPRLVNEIYHVAEHLGVKPRSILDPAMGTGNFFSRLPDSMEKAKLYGVELDSITGRIAQILYPEATIAVTGYEKMPFSDNSFDLVVGNIPFGDITMNDGRYGDQKFLVHDYFMAKSIDVVKDHGVVAFVTSKGTLDKRDDQVRRYLAERADLVGAVRLPSNAFTAIAGTSVTSDVLFFQKRAELRDLTTDMPSWVQAQPFQDSKVTINQYFLDNPDHVLGELEFSSIYGPQSALVCKPRENQDLYKDFRKALIGEESQNLDALFKEIQASDNLTEIVPTGTRNNTYFVHDDQLYYKTISGFEKRELNVTVTKRLKDMCTVKHNLLEVINIQCEADYDTHQFQEALTSLNHNYDAFVKAHGYFNDKTNRSTFSQDDQLPLLLSIEKKSKKDKSISKGDIFFKPTIRPNEAITHVETAHEALILSLSKKLVVDLDFMDSISDFSKDELITELDGMIFQDPTLFDGQDSGWVHRDEYLSGDIKEKLEDATEMGINHPEMVFSKNMAALESVMPAPLKASDIEFQIGSTWIPPDTYQDFMYELFETPNYSQDEITIEYCKYANRWHINAKSQDRGNIKVNSTYGTERANAYEILEKSLNLGQVSIKDKVIEKDGQGRQVVKYVLNVEETLVARAKQDLIKQKFSSWLFENPTRASSLVDIYNERFNRFVPRNYDGSHLEFPNLNSSWKLREHQEDVVARILYSRQALMAHEVGAGKTASMIVSGMRLKQLGAINKPLYVVPSHLTEQFASEFLSMYPTANVLMTTKRDFEKQNRHEFVSKIATNDYDAVIIGHSQFEKIPLSQEREETFLNNQLDEIIEAIEETTADEKSWSVKNMVRFRRKLEEKLIDLREIRSKDNVIDFEQLGVDFMFVDEAHVYKNLLTVTKLENVAGISTSSSQRAMDMFMKCRYIQEQYNGGGVVFATGTPISNSMSELYVMQRFLQYDLLKAQGLMNFDNWASTFGVVTSSLEMTPAGNGYKIKNRFAKFHNLPELMSMFQLVADIQTHDMLDLDRPTLYGGKAQIVISEPSLYQKEMMVDLAFRADLISEGGVDPRFDNMLKITHEAKLMAIDPRLLDEYAAIDEGSKLFQCTSQAYQIWEDHAEKKSTQIIFSDSGTPKKGEFNVYDELKDQLMRKGIPEEEVAFIHDAKTDLQREKLFDQVRAGDVRIIIGSTTKLGTGTNIQDKIIALHHVDCPWRPSDITQRDGRGERQGNDNDVIYIFRYITKGTFDGYLWQIQENKNRYISQVMTGRSISRSCSDLDETVLSAAEVKALATSNPLLSEKMNLDNEVARLQLVKNSWVNERMNLQEKVQQAYPTNIIKLEKDIEIRKTEIATLNAFPVQHDEKGKGIFSIQLNGRTYDNRTDAFEMMTSLITSKSIPKDKRVAIGEYRGLALSAEINNLLDSKIYINGRYGTNFNDFSGIGNLTRLQNRVNELPKDLKQKELELTDNKKNLEQAKLEISKPFDQEERLAELLSRQSEINRKIELDMMIEEKTSEANEIVHDEAIPLDDELLLDDFTPPQGAIGIEVKEKGTVRTKITTWQKATPDEKNQWLTQEGYLPKEELHPTLSDGDEYVEVQNDQFVSAHLVSLEDMPAKEVNQQEYQELA